MSASARLVSLNEAAERWGVKHTQVRYLLNRGGGHYGGFWAQEVGGRMYFLETDVERHEQWLASNTQEVK